MPGPLPKSRAEKDLKENAGKHGRGRKRNKPEEFIEIDTALPEPPEWLSGDARKEWDRLLPLLAELGLMTEIYGTALAELCTWYARAVKCEKELNKGLKIKLKNGYYQKKPEVAIAKDCWAAYNARAAQFAMNPKAWSALRLPQPKKKKPDDDKNTTSEAARRARIFKD